MSVSFDVLQLDAEAEVERITTWLRQTVQKGFKRRGAVLGLSGGIDSSTVAALCVRAFGKNNVLGLLMPEGESAPETLPLSHGVADRLGIAAIHEDISEVLRASGCYERRDSAIRTVIPEYGAGWKCKIVLPNVIEDQRYRIFSVVAESPNGQVHKARLTPEAYLGIVAASNFKQRCRKVLEYYYADQRNYVVAGTPNRLEYDQGFFVKGGDGLADVKPIAHLYKTQVYALAAYLGVPEEIIARPPSTDTYSMAQGQDEFYFSLPYREMDLCLYAKNHGVPPVALVPTLGLKVEQVERVYADIDAKRLATRYLHSKPLLAENVMELAS